ncbi:substrate-binding domain-containing protein [Bacteroidales bacterium OttesenSCG-928-J19]|nr:substrate-binding domain-containing protein [Bacteroidales bacterium OttesenSCG-928-J19]
MKRLSLILSVFLLLCSGCSNNNSNTSGIKLSGMGDNFNYPLFEMLISDYNRENNTQVAYNNNGVCLALSSVQFKSNDFISGVRLYCKEDPTKDLTCLPIAVGAVVIAYNLPRIDTLKLNASIISKIYRGEITDWNHSELVRLNPNLAHCSFPITPIFRADGSSSTYVLSNYLSDSDPIWKREMGAGISIQYKHGIGFIENESVSLNIKETIGSIGYTSTEHAELMRLSSAWIKNSSGQFLKPTTESLMASIPDEFPEGIQTTITDSGTENAYPITAFTWLVLSKKHYAKMSSQEQTELIAFLNYLINPATQDRLPLSNFAPLTPKVLKEAAEIIKKLETNEKER